MINMHTKLIDIDQELPIAIELLASGQVIAFPTETVFGIGADITNISACLDIYRINYYFGLRIFKKSIFENEVF